MKNNLVLLLIIFCSVTFLNAQISKNGIPISWQENIDNTLLQQHIITPAHVPKSDKVNRGKNGSFTFATVIEFNKSIEETGTWTSLNNGDRIWQVRLKSEGAYSLNFTFSRYLLPEGATVFVYSPDKKYKLGAFTSENNKSYGTLAVAPIAGNEIIIEYFEPEDVDFKGELRIGTIGYDYLNTFGEKDGQFGASGSCNIDINCPEGTEWQKQKRAICRMVINNSELCTGSLVNNTLEDQTPYILSANHCVNNEYNAQNTVFLFNYESPSCNGVDGSNKQSISGAELVATKNKDQGYLDFTLLKLSESVPSNYEPYFAGWDSRGNIPQKSTCIHHPWGDVKKISHDYDAADNATYIGYGYDPNSFWRINYWDKGTTEGGSSGSPIFDENARITGTLTGGEASCNVDSCDYFQMFSVSFDKYAADSLQLKHWLAPNQSGIEYLDGYDLMDNPKEITDEITVANWEEGQSLAFYLANDGGYLAGNNIYQDKAKAEFFNKTKFGNRSIVTQAHVAFAYATGNDNELIELQVVQDNFGSPSSVLGSSVRTLGDIKKKADKDYIIYAFDPPVEINGSIYLSVVLPQNEGDTVALMTIEEAEVNTAWELNYENEWLPYSDPENSWGIKLSHIIALQIGSYVGIKDDIKEAEIKLFPNPAQNSLTVEMGNDQQISNNIEIYNTFGRLVLSESIMNKNQQFEINISDLNAGFYVLVIKQKERIISTKFIKE